jgi:signal transduction histidine kinase
MTIRDEASSFENDRLIALLNTLESMASGQLDVRLPLSPRHDALDAIAHGINVLVGELDWVAARTREAQERTAAELRATAASAEARSSAILKAVPDLMFVFLRDGTFVDYYARDPKLLFVPPDAFLGRTVRDVMPAPLAGVIMDACERAWHSDDPIVVEYELPLGEPRFFETRIVAAGADRLLSIVRDVTDRKRASDLIRDLAGRLIARQEVERQRMARELHDDLCQRLVALNIEVSRIAARVDSEQVRDRLRELSAQVSEIAVDVSHMAYELHPSRLRTVGLIAALRALCDETSKQRGVEVTFTHDAILPVVDANVSLCLYRIVQEALHNVVRHSRARDAKVSVTCNESDIALEVVDSGIGFDPAHVRQAGLGIVSMRERAAILDGQLTIEAGAVRGTRIAVRIPMAAQAANAESSA